MTGAIVIRPAQTADISALDRLYQRSYARLLAADYPPSVLVMAIPAIARAQPGLVASGLFYVAEATDGRLLGAGGWSRRAPGGGARSPGTGHIRHVATDPDVTRCGIGRRLMQQIVTDARGSGVGLLHCQSTLTARSFYEAIGFAVQGEIVVPLPGGIAFPALSMLRKL